ncbi:unnamed protein product, partial [marine sediment metagenome]
IKTQLIKQAGIDTVTFHFRGWAWSGAPVVRVAIGGQSGTLTGTATTSPTWNTGGTVNISSLTDTTLYDVSIDFRGTAFDYNYMSSIIAFGSA